MMFRKKIVLACLFAFSTAAVLAQETVETDRGKFNIGFILGGNYSILTQDEGDPTNQKEITNGPGYEMGIGAEFRLYKGLCAAPSAMLMVGGSKVNFANRDLQNLYEVMPIAVGLNANFQYKFGEGVNQPYVILGGKFDIPVEKNDNTDEFGNAPNLGLNVGVGVSHWFKAFMFAPELVYSHGLSNVNQNPSISNEAGLYMHQVSLRLKFMD